MIADQGKDIVVTMTSILSISNTNTTTSAGAVNWTQNGSRSFAQGTTLVLLAWCCFIYYRNNFSRYPGPWLAKWSAWPNWYHAVIGDRHRWLHLQHVRYGPVVQFAPNAVSVNTVGGRDVIYKSQTADLRKGDWYQCVQDSAGGFVSTFTAREKAQHSVKRRLLSHAFSDKALRDYEPRIVDCVRHCLDTIETHTNATDNTIDMGSWTTFLIFDVLGELCFGRMLGLTDNPKRREIVKLVPATTKDWYTLGYHPLTRLIRCGLFHTRLGRYFAGKLLPNNANFRTFCLQQFQERRKRGAVARVNGDIAGLDMFDALLTGCDGDGEQTYTTGDLACETVLLMVAGTQSTSCALASTIFYLVNNPSELVRLEDEVRLAFTTEDEIRYLAGQGLATLPFLRACLLESMRLSPPTPGHLPREVGVEGLHIDGIHFNHGMNVGVCAYALHRNEAYFERPNEFVPSRWIGCQQQDNTLAYNAFSAGSTGCIGKQLAYMELSIIIAMIVWRFDMSITSPAGDKAEYHMQDGFVGDGKGPVVRLLPRGK